MAYNPMYHNRHSIRMKDYDYSSSGLYFITTCVYHKEMRFGEIHDCDLSLNDAGKMVSDEWLKLMERYPQIELHDYIVMPNHFHSILEIRNDDGHHHETLGQMMGAFKSIVTVNYIKGVEAGRWPPFDRHLWQRDYYEHIIRDYIAYDNIANYIQTNPLRWEDDKFHI